jgi:hypothetical protein
MQPIQPDLSGGFGASWLAAMDREQAIADRIKSSEPDIHGCPWDRL